MRIYTRRIPPTELDDKQKAAMLLTDEYQEVITESPFLYLTCDLPPPPLFKDEFMENIIPQVSFVLGRKTCRDLLIAGAEKRASHSVN